MSNQRFSLVFTGLILISAICAFIVPSGYSNVVRGRVDGLFAPVAWPVRRIAQSVSWRLNPPGQEKREDDFPQAPAAARAEIEQLRGEVASLTVQLAEMQRINNERNLIGDIRRYCTAFRVFGGDQGGRDMLMLKGSSGDGLATDMPVLCKSGIVGRVSSGSQVRLITDKGFRVNAVIGHEEKDVNGRFVFRILPTPTLLVEGRGGGSMAISSLSYEQAMTAKIREGDRVVLYDTDNWALAVNGRTLGRIERIDRLARATLFAEIVIRPETDLRQLQEVMVVTGKAPAAQMAAPTEVKPVDAKPAAPKAPENKNGRNAKNGKALG